MKRFPKFIGFDLSTQQLKVVGIEDNLSLCYEQCISFDKDLPEYKTEFGTNGIDGRRTSKPEMWVKALDTLLDRMRIDGVDFGRVCAVSGSAQQHGTVWWGRGARERLTGGKLDPTLPLHSQLCADSESSCFSLADSPIWLHTDTAKQCGQLEAFLGGREEASRLHGSTIAARYSGPHILRIFQDERDTYEATERISVVSSFATSLLLGDYAPIDETDGSGMALMDVRTREWCRDLCDFISPDLVSKLGERVTPAYVVLGTIADYFVKRYGFSSNCAVVPFVGDNLASFAGLSPATNQMVISMGTSDTMFAECESLSGVPIAGTSNYAHPTKPNHFIKLVMCTNGAVAREKALMTWGGGGGTACDWSGTAALLAQTERGCRNPRREGGQAKVSPAGEAVPAALSPSPIAVVGLDFDIAEIICDVQLGHYRLAVNDDNTRRDDDVFTICPASEFTDAGNFRAFLEGQLLWRRMAIDRGFGTGQCGEAAAEAASSATRFTSLLATGGASANTALLQLMADVCGWEVYAGAIPNTACLGAAYRAKHAFLGGPAVVSYEEIVKDLPSYRLCATPSRDRGIYDRMFECLQRYVLHAGKAIKTI